MKIHHIDLSYKLLQIKEKGLRCCVKEAPGASASR